MKQREWQITGRRWGFIDRTGKMVIEACYGFVRDFHFGRALVSSEAGYAFIDSAGRRVIELGKRNASDFSEGLCSVRDSSGKYGYIDTLGRMVIPARYVVAGSFSEGRAYVQFNYGESADSSTGPANSVIPLAYDNIRAFHDGRAAVEVRSSGGTSRQGFIDRKERW